MMNGDRRTYRAAMVVGSAMFVSVAGCDGPLGLTGAANTPLTEQVTETIREDATPEQLREWIEGSQREANELAKLMSGSGQNQSFRASRLQQHIETGVAAADRLLAAATATDAQRSAARQAKLFLLSHGTRHAGSAFRDRLQAIVTELHQAGDDRLAGIGAAVLVEATVLSGEGPHEATMTALVEYARQYPECGAGVALFQQYGARLEKSGRLDEAFECYRTLSAVYGHLPETAPIRTRVASLRQAADAKLNKSQARQEKLEQIRNQLGPSEDGYFVIYANEVKPPSSKLFELYKFEYEVLHGATAAASYIAGLKSNWQWELVKRFPESPDAYSQAAELAKQLTKKRAFIKY